LWCENVKAGDIRQSLEYEARDLYGIKLRTRLGMGSCQGSYCMMNAGLLIAQQTCTLDDKLGVQSVRPPALSGQIKKYRCQRIN